MWIAQKHIYNIYVQQIISTCVENKVKIKRHLLEMEAFCAMMRTSLHASPCCELTAPFQQALLAPTPPPKHPLNPIFTHVIFLTGRWWHRHSGIFLCSGTSTKPRKLGIFLERFELFIEIAAFVDFCTHMADSHIINSLTIINPLLFETSTI